jgi:tRNA (guanine-N7-)-methyltransferase
VAERELTNVRIHSDDSRPLLYRMANASLDRAFLLFPDPWRKRRHAERRFIGPKNLDLMARLLKDGAEFRVASDHMPYIDWTLMHVMPHPAFEWTAERPGDWMTQPEDWVPTRYEQKAIRQGRRPVYLSFRRKVRDANDQG